MDYMLTHVQGVCYTRTSLMSLTLLAVFIFWMCSGLSTFSFPASEQALGPPRTMDLSGEQERIASSSAMLFTLEPLPISREAYEAALTRPAVHTLNTLASTTHLGLAIHWKEFHAFFPYLTLGVVLPELPGIERLREVNTFSRTARLTLARVVTRAGKEVYDKTSTFEKPPFDGLTLQPLQEFPGYVEAIREVHVQKGVKAEDIRSIEGQVILDLPVNVQPLEFMTNEVGETKARAGSIVTLTTVHESEYDFQYKGDIRNFIRFFGYDAKGHIVPILSQRADALETHQPTTSLLVTFREPVVRVKVFVADEIFTKTLPFQLKMGK